MITCIHKINMRTFSYLGTNAEYVIEWSLMRLGYIPSRCDIKWYDKGSIRTFEWTKPC